MTKTWDTQFGKVHSHEGLPNSRPVRFRPEPAYCKHCEAPVRPCRCVAHPPPMWFHWPSRHHRCGPEGTGETFAEPDSD